MAKCPNCEAEIGEGDSFCKSCGTKLIGSSENQTKAGSSMDEGIERTVVKRLDGIKNKDEDTVKTLLDERYSKFDDWPPFTKQETAEALENEFGAFKVLSNYSYELKDFGANVIGDIALATFTIHYQGVIRNRPFDVTSRVTSVLRKRDSGWKVVHEHFSRFPEDTRQQPAALPTVQPTPSSLPPSYPVGRDRTRRFAVLGFIVAAFSLFILPEILGSVAIVLGAYAWRREKGSLGIIVVIFGIMCMIVGIEVTSFILAG